MLVFKEPLFYLIVIPKLYADELDMPNTNCTVLPLSQKVKILEEKLHAEVAKIYCTITYSDNKNEHSHNLLSQSIVKNVLFYLRYYC